jgi:hypothetical protein
MGQNFWKQDHPVLNNSALLSNNGQAKVSDALSFIPFPALSVRLEDAEDRWLSKCFGMKHVFNKFIMRR